MDTSKKIFCNLMKSDVVWQEKLSKTKEKEKSENDFFEKKLRKI